MRSRLFNYLWAVLGLAWLVSPLAGAVRVVPTPQYIEPTKEVLLLAPSTPVVIVLGPAQVAGNEKLRLAADFLRHDLEQADRSLQVAAQTGSEEKAGGAHIYLWDYSADHKPGVEFSFLDGQVLTDPDHHGQSYVIRTPDEKSMWIIGGTDQGVLLGAMSVLQLMQKTSDGIEIPGVYVRDYPDFQYRSEDWLLNSEINRWALDRGQGVEAYRRLCERKLNEALRFKINMIFLDGFGWGLKQRFAGYGELMQGLNRFARARGIHLLYGGYGASYGISYQTGPLYEEGAYLGQVFENRESYPHGPTYECMGFPRAKKGVNPKILGSCRANDELNKLKGEELHKFVEAVEPGALFIHHEDFGGYRGSEEAWQQRCSRCLARWPNNSLAARDGGAGGLAHGYSALIEAVNSVKNSSDGYDASRDCIIILVSPVYSANSRSSDDWSKALELWKNIGHQLPEAKNIQICWREIFPQKYGSETWEHTFNSVMRTAGLHLGSFMYFSGGADDYTTDYPLTGTPVMDAEFLGATSMYKATGNIYEEPMGVIDAEYSWNSRSTGFFRAPLQYDLSMQLLRQYMYGKDEPPEVFGAGGIYEIACNLLYGAKAGPPMASYYKESAWVPDTEEESAELENLTRPARPRYLPMVWDRAYAIPWQWRNLALDSKTWSTEITNQRYAEVMAQLKLTPQELHRRLARRWTTLGDLNARAGKDVEEALSANPRSSCVEDIQFLQTSFQIHQPLMQALAVFHAGMARYLASPGHRAGAKQDFQKALGDALRAQKLAAKAFGPPIDPVGGEVGPIRTYTARLAQVVQQILNETK